MARAETETFGKFQILVGDGGSPEEFSIICGLTSKGMQRVASTNTTVTPDCDDEDLPGYEEDDVASFKCSISGSGVWTAQNHDTLLKWFRTGSRKNVKVRNMSVGAGDIEFEEGPAVLTTLSQTGEKGGKVQAEIAISFTEMPSTVAKASVAPANTMLPSISGLATENATLTALPGTWTNNPTSFTYQWKRDGMNISGATVKTYTLVEDDVGAAITVAVTATNAAGSASATSGPTAEVIAA